MIGISWDGSFQGCRTLRSSWCRPGGPPAEGPGGPGQVPWRPAVGGGSRRTSLIQGRGLYFESRTKLVGGKPPGTDWPGVPPRPPKAKPKGTPKAVAKAAAGGAGEAQ